MEQAKLKERVRRIFEQQGFEVKSRNNLLTAEKEGEEKVIQVFSSKEYTGEDVKSEAESGALVFVDEPLEDLKLENEISVIREKREEAEYDLPSYELIGDIAVINELTTDKGETVEGIREHHPHVKTILLKEEPLSGEFRTGAYRKLYGDETETIHKEFGCRYRVDPTKSYFSERLGTERERVSDQVEQGEKVLVLGAGVGPYPVLIARRSNPGRVVAVEKNPDAVEYLRQNIELNNVSDTVEAIEGDALELDLDEKFDRVIIAVPEFGEEFLENAFNHLEENGIIYYYRFREDEDWNPLLDEVGEVADRMDIEYSIRDKIVCGNRGPSVDRVCIEIERK